MPRESSYDGKVLVSIRRMCENLGVSFQGQHAKLKKESWPTIKEILTVGADGKSREMTMLLLDHVPMWLVTIHPSKVAAAVKPALVRYQRECRDVLARHFGLGGGGQVNVDTLLARLDQRFAPVTAIESVDARLKALEAKVRSIELDGFINEDQVKEVEALLRRVAKDNGVSFRQAHGWLKTETKTNSFRFLLTSKFDDALGHLRSLLKPESEPQEVLPNLDELVDLGEGARILKISTFMLRELALDRGIKIHTEYDKGGPGRRKEFIRRKDLHKLQAFRASNPKALN